MLKFTAGVIITLLLVAIIGGGYFWLNKPQLTKPIPVTSTPTPSQFMPQDKTATASSDSYEKPIEGFVNAGSTIDAIKTNVKTKLYGNLASYMSASVSVSLNGITKTYSKTATIDQLSVLDGAKQPWDFSSTNPVASQLIANDPVRFKNTVIGTTTNYYVVSFAFDDVYLIRRIFISKNYRPLITK